MLCYYYMVFLVEGIFLLIYNIILLKSVKKNESVAIFKTVKLGCLIFMYLQLIDYLLYFVYFLIALAI